MGLLVSGALVFAAPFLGVAVTMLFLSGAFRDTASVDPSHKARFLAERISEAMNGAAFGIGISLLAMIPTVIFAVRLHRERKTNTYS
ncbi:MAG: MotA/TolQ/ExbB proton channel family protein [Polyangiaceae bacterium]